LTTSLQFIENDEYPTGSNPKASYVSTNIMGYCTPDFKKTAELGKDLYE